MALAVKAGTDLTCGYEYGALPEAVRDHLISVADIDRAVERLYTARFRLGMFDPAAMVPWSKLTLRITIRKKIGSGAAGGTRIHRIA